VAVETRFDAKYVTTMVTPTTMANTTRAVSLTAAM
jgi:hypothetical protein